MTLTNKSLEINKKLTEKEQRFVEEYLVDLNATQAAARAKYSLKTCSVIGYQLLRKAHIQVAIQELGPEKVLQERRKDQQKWQNREGELYLIQCLGFPYYKMGYTYNLAQRLAALQHGVPFKLEVVKTVKIDQASDVKNLLYRKYQDKLIRGEWLQFSPQEISQVMACFDSLELETIRMK